MKRSNEICPLIFLMKRSNEICPLIFLMKRSNEICPHEIAILTLPSAIGQKAFNSSSLTNRNISSSDRIV
jgi:ribosome modulation factor